MDLSGFDATQIEPNVPYEPIPAGKYKAVIVASESKPTKAMTGSYLQLEIEIIEGQFQGRKVFDRLNLDNPNSTAVEIAQRTLSAICRAVGVNMPRHSSDLHNKPMLVNIAVKPADGQYSASNEVKGYGPDGGSSGNVGAPHPHSVTHAQPVAAAGSSTPPWKR